MTGRLAKLLRFLPIVAVLALAACGGGGDTETTTTTTPTLRSLRIYFLKDGKVQPVLRQIGSTIAVASAALAELTDGPRADESQALGLRTAVPASTLFGDLAVKDGVATFTTSAPLERLALAQVVYTLTQFPTVKAVETGGKRYTRADFETETPQILVESPLPFQAVKSPLKASGTANTFEATFEYDLYDPQARIVKHNFVTATSGNGVRGTFDFSTPFEVEESGLGKLVVYERSAENGQRVNIVQIPIQLGG
jgi:hypothetical protein